MRIILSLTTITLANSRSYVIQGSRSVDRLFVRMLPTPARREIVTYIVFFQDICDSPEYPLRIEMQAQLSDDQTAPCLQQSTIGAEQLQHFNHEACKVRFFGRGGYLGQELQVVLDHLQHRGRIVSESAQVLGQSLTSSEGSDKVLSSAGKVPLSLDKICLL